MKRLVLLALVVVSSGALLAACGSSEKTAKIGTSEVTIAGEPDSLVATIRATAEQFPYEKWAFDCVVGQIEKVIGPAEEERLEGASEKEFGEFILPHLTAMNKACERPDRHTFNPDASEEELALVRSSEVVGVRAILKAAGVSAAERECVEDRVAHLPGPELVALLEADEAQREVLFVKLGSPCVES
jgi:outer membrane murein-binding lipoprotein Lpp